MRTIVTNAPSIERVYARNNNYFKQILSYCGTFAQSKNCAARETAVASERL
jgi:hypothetical protein